MPDKYISREAALKDFEASNAENPRWTPQRVKTLLLRQPAADVAAVVRCATYKYGRRTVNYYTGEQQGGTWCSLHDILNVSPDDFCSYGEYQTNTGGVAE